MDLTNLAAPRSDQMNADDLIGGPRTFTIADVRPGSAEQPVNVHLAEFPRPWRPSKTALRVLMHAWGTESTAYTGKRLTLFCDSKVKFGGKEVGGIRISHMSDIPRQIRLALTATRGQKQTHIIDPLPDDAPTSEPVSEVDLLRKEWKTASPERRQEIEAEIAAVKGGAE